MLVERSGSFSFVLERPFSPFPIQYLLHLSDLDLLFNRGRVSFVTWNPNLLSSNLRASSQGTSGNSGYASFSSKFFTPHAWKLLTKLSSSFQSGTQKNILSPPISPIVCVFSEQDPGDGEWGYGNFPLEEYIKALDRSKGELHYNHALGMRYSKVCSTFRLLVLILSLFFVQSLSSTILLLLALLQITEQIYVGSCLQTEDDVENLSDAVSCFLVDDFYGIANIWFWLVKLFCFRELLLYSTSKVELKLKIGELIHKKSTMLARNLKY